MADRGPNYTISRKRVELEIEEHRNTIEKGEARISEIERAKKMNFARVEVSNLELDDEAARVAENHMALDAKIAELLKNLELMVKEK